MENIEHIMANAEIPPADAANLRTAIQAAIASAASTSHAHPASVLKPTKPSPYNGAIDAVHALNHIDS